MVKYAWSGAVIGGILIGIFLIKKGLEQRFSQLEIFLTPEISLFLGIFILIISWMRLKNKR